MEIDDKASAIVPLKTGSIYRQIVTPNRDAGKGIDAFRVGGCFEPLLSVTTPPILP
jgi:hypothetical protein